MTKDNKLNPPIYARKRASLKPEGDPSRKGMRGSPQMHEQVKENINLKITPQGKLLLSEIATETNLSRSEVVEQLVREFKTELIKMLQHLHNRSL